MSKRTPLSSVAIFKGDVEEFSTEADHFVKAALSMARFDIDWAWPKMNRALRRRAIHMLAAHFLATAKETARKRASGARVRRRAPSADENTLLRTLYGQRFWSLVTTGAA
jgi:hypothetical protein